MTIEYDEKGAEEAKELDLAVSLLAMYEVGYDYYDVNEKGINLDGSYTMLIGYPDEKDKTRTFTRQEVIDCFRHDIAKGEVAKSQQAWYLNKFK